jgi:hypothetical protein
LELEEINGLYKADKFIKPGDQVICVDVDGLAANHTDPIKLHEVYVVKSVFSHANTPSVYFEDKQGFWFLRRFKLYSSEVKKELETCVCSNNQLFWGGCICGFFQKEQKSEAGR